jgi:hypothetical protein
MAWSMGFRVSVSLHPALQVTGLWLLPWRDCLPLHASAFSGRTVEHQLERGGLLHREVRRRGALQDSIHVVRRALIEGRKARPVGHEATSFRKVLVSRDHRQRMSRCELEDLTVVLHDRRIIEDDEHFGTRAGGGLKGAREVARTAYGKGQKLKPQLGARLLHLRDLGRVARIVCIKQPHHA